jgi:hypothetical protein
VNDELEGMWKEVVAACRDMIITLSWEETEENNFTTSGAESRFRPEVLKNMG